MLAGLSNTTYFNPDGKAMEPETFITRTSDTELTFAAAGTDLVRTRVYTVFSLTRLRIPSAFLVVRACVFFFLFCG